MTTKLGIIIHLYVFLIGLGLGISLFQAAFGFTGGWRNFIEKRDSKSLRAQLIMLALAVIVFSIFINSKIDDPLVSKDSGNAFRFRMTTSPTKTRYHDVGIFYFDENLDITDMGYQMENNWLFVGSQNGLKVSDMTTVAYYARVHYQTYFPRSYFTSSYSGNLGSAFTTKPILGENADSSSIANLSYRPASDNIILSERFVFVERYAPYIL